MVEPAFKLLFKNLSDLPIIQGCVNKNLSILGSITDKFYIFI